MLRSARSVASRAIQRSRTADDRENIVVPSFQLRSDQAARRSEARCRLPDLANDLPQAATAFRDFVPESSAASLEVSQQADGRTVQRFRQNNELTD